MNQFGFDFGFITNGYISLTLAFGVAS